MRKEILLILATAIIMPIGGKIVDSATDGGIIRWLDLSGISNRELSPDFHNWMRYSVFDQWSACYEAIDIGYSAAGFPTENIVKRDFEGSKNVIFEGVSNADGTVPFKAAAYCVENPWTQRFDISVTLASIGEPVSPIMGQIVTSITTKFQME